MQDYPFRSQQHKTMFMNLSFSSHAINAAIKVPNEQPWKLSYHQTFQTTSKQVHSLAPKER